MIVLICVALVVVPVSVLMLVIPWLTKLYGAYFDWVMK